MIAAASFDTWQLIALAGALGWASGVRLYAVLFIVGGLGFLGWIPLPGKLDVLAHPYVLAASGAMFAIEFFADKIPGVDSLWDFVQTFVRIPAGAALAAGVFGDAPAAWTLAAAILGGTLGDRQPSRQVRQPDGDQHVARAVLELGRVVRRGSRRRRHAVARVGASDRRAGRARRADRPHGVADPQACGASSGGWSSGSARRSASLPPAAIRRACRGDRDDGRQGDPLSDARDGRAHGDRRGDHVPPSRRRDAIARASIRRGSRPRRRWRRRSRTRRAADNFRNLFEAPVLFYAAVLTIYAAQLTAPCISRSHGPTSSRASCTRRSTARTTASMHRLPAFATSLFLLWTLWGLLAFDLLVPRTRGHRMFDKILIANRGEIAVRVARTARRLGHPHRGRVLGRRRATRCTSSACDEAYRLGPPPPRESYLDGDEDHRDREGERRAGDPPGLRLPVRERGVRRGVRARRHRVHRSAAGGDRRDGLEVGGEDDHGRGGRAARARLSRRRPGSRAARARGGEDRLPGADQGDGGRRRQGHEDRDRRRASSPRRSRPRSARRRRASATIAC